MTAIAGTRIRNPAHPGAFLKSEIIEPSGLSLRAAARVLGVGRPMLSTLLDEHSPLSSEMALRMEKAFGVSMDTLMRMQNSYDVAQASNGYGGRGDGCRHGASRRSRQDEHGSSALCETHAHPPRATQSHHQL